VFVLIALSFAAFAAASIPGIPSSKTSQTSLSCGQLHQKACMFQEVALLEGLPLHQQKPQLKEHEKSEQHDSTRRQHESPECILLASPYVSVSTGCGPDQKSICERKSIASMVASWEPKLTEMDGN